MRPASNARPRSGRALLIAAVVLLVLGLLLLWIWPAERPAGRGLETQASSAPDSTRGERAPATPEYVASGAPRSELAPAASDELAPFAPTRSESTRPSGALGSLRGRVEVSGEEPFPQSWRLVLKPSAILPEREHAEARTLSFEDGRREFETRDLPLGGYDVSAQAPGFNGQVLSFLLQPGSENAFVNLRMVPAGRLEGRILDPGGVPAEGIPVTLFSVPEASELTVESDANGLYRFEALPDGGYELLVGRPSAPLIPERHPLRFQAPSLTFPDIELPPLGEIHVRVVDSLERPVEGVVVRGSGTRGGLVEGRTDYDGRLVVKHLPAGHFRLRLEHPSQEERYSRRIALDVEAGKVAEAPVRLGP